MGVDGSWNLSTACSVPARWPCDDAEAFAPFGGEIETIGTRLGGASAGMQQSPT
jgi:hypothetical protein